MTHLKGLAAIAVCGHNFRLNTTAYATACVPFGITIVSGIEVGKYELLKGFSTIRSPYAHSPGYILEGDSALET